LCSKLRGLLKIEKTCAAKFYEWPASPGAPPALARMSLSRDRLQPALGDRRTEDAAHDEHRKHCARDQSEHADGAVFAEEESDDEAGEDSGESAPRTNEADRLGADARSLRRSPRFWIATPVLFSGPLNLDRYPSAQVRAAHQLQGGLDVSPGFSLFPLALFLVGVSPLSGLDDRHLPMGLQQLARVIVDVDFSDPHDAVLLACETILHGSRLGRLEHDPEKACPGLDPGWKPVFRKDHAQTKR
jgi:hypothetical protein